MSKYNNITYSNTNQNHPLQQNSQNYYLYKKYVSIHSEDRDVLAYPNSAEFEIELPEDINNITTMKLVNWAFPSNYDTFSILNSNITILLKLTELYDYPTHYPVITNTIDFYIYTALNDYIKSSSEGIFRIFIEEGFYNPNQLSKELQNKFNESATKIIEKYLADNFLLLELSDFVKDGGYKRFVVAYNNVSQIMWFGNQADSFEFLNEKIFLENSKVNETLLCKKNQVPDFSNWGLPGNLGLTRCNTKSLPSPKEQVLITHYNDVIIENYMRFYYGDVIDVADNGVWLAPPLEFGSTTTILKNAVVQYIQPTYKINIFGQPEIYMEIAKYNCIDETQPYNISRFTLTTNETNGIVNSAFAKIPVVSTPLSQYYDGPCISYKFFDPPVDRIRRLKFRLRYHNGELVNFGVFEYNFTLEFTTLLPMINRSVHLVNNIFQM